MTAYRRVDDLTVTVITCGLTACTPGSAPVLTLGNEYWKPLPFTFYHINIADCRVVSKHKHCFLKLSFALVILIVFF